MAKHDTDPVLQQLVHAVNQSGRARVPVTVCAHGTVVTGVLIAQEVYFAELAEGNPLLSALQPESGVYDAAPASGNEGRTALCSQMQRSSTSAASGWGGLRR